MRAPALDAAVVAAYPAYHHLASVAGRDDRNKLRVLLLAGRVDREETEEHYAQDEEQDEWILLKAKRTTKGDYTLGAPASLACLDSAQLDSPTTMCLQFDSDAQDTLYWTADSSEQASSFVRAINRYVLLPPQKPSGPNRLGSAYTDEQLLQSPSPRYRNGRQVQGSPSSDTRSASTVVTEPDSGSMSMIEPHALAPKSSSATMRNSRRRAPAPKQQNEEAEADGWDIEEAEPIARPTSSARKCTNRPPPSAFRRDSHSSAPTPTPAPTSTAPQPEPRRRTPTRSSSTHLLAAQADDVGLGGSGRRGHSAPDATRTTSRRTAAAMAAAPSSYDPEPSPADITPPRRDVSPLSYVHDWGKEEEETATPRATGSPMLLRPPAPRRSRTTETGLPSRSAAEKGKARASGLGGGRRMLATHQSLSTDQVDRIRHLSPRPNLDLEPWEDPDAMVSEVQIARAQRPRQPRRGSASASGAVPRRPKSRSRSLSRPVTQQLPSTIRQQQASHPMAKMRPRKRAKLFDPRAFEKVLVQGTPYADITAAVKAFAARPRRRKPAYARTRSKSRIRHRPSALPRLTSQKDDDNDNYNDNDNDNDEAQPQSDPEAWAEAAELLAAIEYGLTSTSTFAVGRPDTSVKAADAIDATLQAELNAAEGAYRIGLLGAVGGNSHRAWRAAARVQNPQGKVHDRIVAQLRSDAQQQRTLNPVLTSHDEDISFLLPDAGQVDELLDGVEDALDQLDQLSHLLDGAQLGIASAAPDVAAIRKARHGDQLIASNAHALADELEGLLAYATNVPSWRGQQDDYGYGYDYDYDYDYDYGDDSADHPVLPHLPQPAQRLSLAPPTAQVRKASDGSRSSGSKHHPAAALRSASMVDLPLASPPPPPPSAQAPRPRSSFANKSRSNLAEPIPRPASRIGPRPDPRSRRSMDVARLPPRRSMDVGRMDSTRNMDAGHMDARHSVDVRHQSRKSMDVIGQWDWDGDALVVRDRDPSRHRDTSMGARNRSISRFGVDLGPERTSIVSRPSTSARRTSFENPHARAPMRTSADVRRSAIARRSTDTVRAPPAPIRAAHPDPVRPVSSMSIGRSNLTLPLPGPIPDWSQDGANDALETLLSSPLTAQGDQVAALESAAVEVYKRFLALSDARAREAMVPFLARFAKRFTTFATQMLSAAVSRPTVASSRSPESRIGEEGLPQGVALSAAIESALEPYCGIVLFIRETAPIQYRALKEEYAATVRGACYNVSSWEPATTTSGLDHQGTAAVPVPGAVVASAIRLIQSVSGLMAAQHSFVIDLLHLSSVQITFADYLSLEPVFVNQAAQVRSETPLTRADVKSELLLDQIFYPAVQAVEARVEQARHDGLGSIAVLAGLESALAPSSRPDAPSPEGMEYALIKFNSIRTGLVAQVDRMVHDELQIVRQSFESAPSFAHSLANEGGDKNGLGRKLTLKRRDSYQFHHPDTTSPAYAYVLPGMSRVPGWIGQAETSVAIAVRIVGPHAAAPRGTQARLAQAFARLITVSLDMVHARARDAARQAPEQPELYAHLVRSINLEAMHNAAHRAHLRAGPASDQIHHVLITTERARDDAVHMYGLALLSRPWGAMGQFVRRAGHAVDQGQLDPLSLEALQPAAWADLVEYYSPAVVDELIQSLAQRLASHMNLPLSSTVNNTKSSKKQKKQQQQQQTSPASLQTQRVAQLVWTALAHLVTSDVERFRALALEVFRTTQVSPEALDVLAWPVDPSSVSGWFHKSSPISSSPNT